MVETQEFVSELVKEKVSVVEESGPALVTPLVTETRVDTCPQQIKPTKGKRIFDKQIYTSAQLADLDLSRKVYFFLP